MGHVKEIKLEQICSIDIRDFGVGERPVPASSLIPSVCASFSMMILVNSSPKSNIIFEKFKAKIKANY